MRSPKLHEGGTFACLRQATHATTRHELGQAWFKCIGSSATVSPHKHGSSALQNIVSTYPGDLQELRFSDKTIAIYIQHIQQLCWGHTRTQTTSEPAQVSKYALGGRTEKKNKLLFPKKGEKKQVEVRQTYSIDRLEIQAWTKLLQARAG